MFYMCIATLFLPYPVILVALFDIFSRLPSFGLQGAKSWVDTFLPLIVPAFFGNPFYIFLMRQFMLGIPQRAVGCGQGGRRQSEIQTFWKVILPLTKPAIVVVAIFAAVGAWNEFLLPLLYLQDNSKYPLAVGLAFYTSEHDVAYNLLMAASMLVVLPIILVLHLRPAVLRRGHHRRRGQGLTRGRRPAGRGRGRRPTDLARRGSTGGWPTSDAVRGAGTCRPTADRSRSGSRRWVVQELVTEAILVHEARGRRDHRAEPRPETGADGRLTASAVGRLVETGHGGRDRDPARRARLLRPERRSLPTPRGATGPPHPVPDVATAQDAIRRLAAVPTWVRSPRPCRSTPARGPGAASWATSIAAS